MNESPEKPGRFSLTGRRGTVRARAAAVAAALDSGDES